MQPVQVPPVVAGMDARLAAAQVRGALSKANKNLRDSRTWYDKVREDYSK
jgi:hypothetical protein